MATTTTIYATKGTMLDGDNTSTNYGTATTWTIGQQTSLLSASERANVVMSFDVSAYTKPSDIVRATLNLTTAIAGNSGNGVGEIYAYRLDQDFTEVEATWNEADDGVDWTGGTTVGAANNSAITQYTKSARNKLVGKCNVGFRVTTEPDIDITELVKDAINRRDGTLLIWVGLPLSDTDTTTRRQVVVRSNNDGTESNRPKIDIVVAERVLWNGSVGDGNMDTAGNWTSSGLNIPNDDDFAVFNTGSVSVIRGTMNCNKCFVGKEYRGTIEATDTSSIAIDCKEMILNSPRSKWHLDINEVTADEGCAIWVGDTNGTSGSSKFEGGTGTSGTYTVIVRKARSLLEINSTTIDDVDVHGGARVLMLYNANVRSTRSRLTFLNGAKACIFAGGTSAYFSDSITNKGNLTLVGKSVVTVYSGLIDDVTIYSGRVGFMGNSNAPVVVGDVVVYREGTFNTKTGSTTFELNTGKNITLYGGSASFDPSAKVAIA